LIVQHILDLDARGFPPRLAAVADMANSLRAKRHLGQVGLNWPVRSLGADLSFKFNLIASTTTREPCVRILRSLQTSLG